MICCRALVNRDHPANRVRADHLALKGSVALLVCPVSLVRSATRDRKANPAQMAQTAFQGLLVPQGRKVRRDQRATMVRQGHQDPQASKVSKVYRDRKASKVYPVRSVPKGPRVPPARKANRGRSDHQARKANPVHQGCSAARRVSISVRSPSTNQVATSP
jgi:hypothetical protein